MNLLHNDLESLLTPGTIVAHYKRDRYLRIHKNDEKFDKNMYIYQICGIASDTERNYHYVVYQAMYGRREVFIRRIDDFLETVEEKVGEEVFGTPRFAIYTEPVDVVNPLIPTPKKHNEAKKLHKKIKNLAAEVQKLREENDQLKKEAADRCSLKKSVKNPSISVVPDTVKEASPLFSTTGPKPGEVSALFSTTDLKPLSMDSLANAPIEPKTVKAHEMAAHVIADKLYGELEDALTKYIPKELVKGEKNC